MLPYPPGVSGGGTAGGGGGGAEMGKRKSISPARQSGKGNINAGSGSGGKSIRMGSSSGRRPSHVKGSKGSASPPASSHPLAGFLVAISNISMGSRGSKGGSRGSRPSSRRAVSARTPSRKAAGGGGGESDVAGGGGGGSTRSAGGARGRSWKNKGSVQMGSGSGPRSGPGQGQPSVRHPAGQTTGGVRGGNSRSFRTTNVRNNPNNNNNNNNNNNGSGWVSRQVSGAMDARASILSNSYSAAAQLAASVVASLTMQQQLSPNASFAPRRSFLPPVSRARSRHPSMLPGGRRSLQNR